MTKSGNTWWSSRFLRSLERLGLTANLQRGREYLGRGHGLSLVVGTGGVEAWGAPRPTSDGHDNEAPQASTEYHCRIEFAPFTDLEWEESFERLAFWDLSAAALLTTGRLPPHIEDFFTPSGRRLLPQQSEEIELSCSCPEGHRRHEARMGLCEHLAATAYLFAERLDRDPWLLFLVRGRSADAVKAALAERWNRDTPKHPEEGASGCVPESSVETMPEDVDLFWEGTRRFEPGWEVPVGKHFPTARRLGTPEPKVDEKAWSDLLLELYSAMSKRARLRLGSD